MKPQATESKTWDPMLLPCFLGGAGSIPAGAVVEHWLPQPMANGVGFFLAWMLVGIVFSFRPPTPKWTLWRWTLGAAVGTIVGAGIAYLMQE
jgi:hypothetical protein